MGEKRKRTNRTKYPEHREGKYLTFALAGEEYGLPILMIKEIMGLIPSPLSQRHRNL